MIVYFQRILLAGFVFVLIGIVGCSAPAEPQLQLSGAWVRLPPGGRDVTGGYVHIANTGGADALVFASSPVAEHVEIHEHIEQDGMMQMREVPNVPVPANEQVAFKPGGYHLMMFGVGDLKPGQMVELILHFERSGTIRVQAIVGQKPPTEPSS